jgi:4-carboxymuconolactone decarboxylase
MGHDYGAPRSTLASAARRRRTVTAERDERIERGRATAAKLFPPGAPGGTGGVRLRAPKEIDRDWRRFTTATVMGDVWSRPGLDIKTRSMIVLAALTVLHRPNELRLHLHGALNLGVTREEICEIIMQMALYGGFPTSVEGMRIAAEVFDEVDEARGARPEGEV